MDSVKLGWNLLFHLKELHQDKATVKVGKSVNFVLEAHHRSILAFLTFFTPGSFSPLYPPDIYPVSITGIPCFQLRCQLVTTDSFTFRIWSCMGIFAFHWRTPRKPNALELRTILIKGEWWATKSVFWTGSHWIMTLGWIPFTSTHGADSKPVAQINSSCY